MRSGRRLDFAQSRAMQDAEVAIYLCYILKCKHDLGKK